MTIRNELIRTARWAQPTLGEPARAQVLGFLNSQRVGGGFAGRSDPTAPARPAAGPDLYYTLFGLQAWLAVEAASSPLSPADATPIPRTDDPPVDPAFLARLAGTEDLDLVHTCSLIRCWACLGDVWAPPPPDLVRALSARLAGFRLGDGGFNHAGLDRSSAYGDFLALGAIQDLRDLGCPGEWGDLETLARGLDRLRAPGGGYVNPPSTAPSAPATAGALVALRHLGQTRDDQSALWLLACHGADGGFRASALAPAGDLLSTGTALYALAVAGQDLASIREPALDFLAGLWSPKGGFRGHPLDDVLDCEYTFYGLLALGVLR